MLDFNLILKNDSSPTATAATLKEFWDKALFHPWQEVKQRPSKAIRAEFVRLGWHLSGSKIEIPDDVISKISEIVETLHLGSLIVDDIQDDSIERRGGPTLHKMYGVPLALNLGNFLYFQALHLISNLQVSTEYKNAAMNQVALTLRDAHLGQALDVAIAIDEVCRTKIPKLVETSLRLKSGALMKLSIHLGALLNPNFKKWDDLHRFGEAFGSCLQKFDDIGNFTTDSTSKKQLEDLMLRRPSWIWSTFAQQATDQEWSQFTEAVRDLPDITALANFLNTSLLKKRSFELACADLEENLNTLQKDFCLSKSDPAFEIATKLTKKLTHAY